MYTVPTTTTRKGLLIITMLIVSLACMTSTIPEKQEQAPQLTPTQTAIVATVAKAEPAAGAVFEIPTAQPLCARVTAIQSLHLRAEPNERARVLAYLKNGEQVRVITFGQSTGLPSGLWWKIETDVLTGYANAKYLSLTECEQ